jgi:polyribonucleotide nucleotidyltransferase
MIGTLIGPGGKTVRRIQDESGGATIDIQEDGTVIVGSPNEEVARKAIRMIEGLTKEVQVGEIYTGRVTRLLNFGAFVEILPGKEGLIHISQLGAEHVRSVEDEVKVGDEVTVMVSEIDNLGRINLSRRAVLLGETPEQAAAASRDGGRDRDRGPRGGGPCGSGGGSRPSDRDRSGRGGGQAPQRASQPQPVRPSPASPGPVGGATRGWVRRTPPAEGAPPPPRRDFGGGMNED